MKARFSNRFWIILLGAAFVACAALSLRLFRPDSGRAVARVEVDGEVVREIDLSAVAGAYRFEVETPGGVNVVEVRPGGIRVADADCPDQVCVKRGWLEGGRLPVVCLPHRLVISLVSGGDDDALDAVAG